MTKKEILEEARRKYPLGTQYYPVNTKELKEIETQDFIFSSSGTNLLLVKNLSGKTFDNVSLCIFNGSSTWAKVISTPFIEEDNNDLIRILKKYKIK